MCMLAMVRIAGLTRRPAAGIQPAQDSTKQIPKKHVSKRTSSSKIQRKPTLIEGADTQRDILPARRTNKLVRVDFGERGHALITMTLILLFYSITYLRRSHRAPNHFFLVHHAERPNLEGDEC
jgi:hypothetical protein